VARGALPPVEVLEAEGPVPTSGPDPEALEEAYHSGVAAGRAAVEEAMADERARLSATITEVAALRRRIFDTAEHEVMTLALGVAQRILHREVQLAPDILLAMARVALGRMGDRVEAVIRLHPADLAAVTQGGAPTDGLALEADATVPRGGCQVESGVGSVDLGVDAQLNELSRLLLGEAGAVVDHAHLH
jgi:flagellar assembly protein FliH